MPDRSHAKPELQCKFLLGESKFSPNASHINAILNVYPVLPSIGRLSLCMSKSLLKTLNYFATGHHETSDDELRPHFRHC